MTNNLAISLALCGLLLVACGSAPALQDAEKTATRLANDFFHTQTAFARFVGSQDSPDATDTSSVEENFNATLTSVAARSTLTSQFSQAVVNIASLNVRSGPGTEYAVIGYAYEGDVFVVLGQAYYCEWLQIEMPDGNIAWVSTMGVDYTRACTDIAEAPIPPAPTQAASTPLPACESMGSIEVVNSTGAWITLVLAGPAPYNFDLGPGTTTLSVCSGSYGYTAYGCGGASDSGTTGTGESIEFYCQ